MAHPESKREQKAREQRNRLVQREARARRELVRRYQNTYANIDIELTRLDKQIADAIARGEDIRVSWLHKQQRLTQLRKRIELEIDKYAVDANRIIAAQKRVAAELGAQDAKQLAALGLGPKPAGIELGTIFGDIAPSAIEEIVATTRAGTPTRNLLNKLGGDMGDLASQTLVDAIATGQNPRTVIAQLRKQLGGIPAYRAERIARTEMLGAYREASRQTYAANPDVVKQWQWNAALDRRCCAGCQAMHGTKHPISEPMGSHVNCRCTMIPVTASWADLGFHGIPEPFESIQLDDAGQRALDEFRRMPAAERVARYGPGKAEAIADGRIELQDMLNVRRDPTWGASHGEASLRDSLRNAERRRAGVSRKRA